MNQIGFYSWMWKKWYTRYCGKIFGLIHYPKSDKIFFFYFRDVWAKKFSTPSHMYRLFADWNFSFILSVLIYVPYPFRMRAIMALHTFLLFVALSNFQPFMIIVFIFFLILPFIHSSWQTSRLLTILFNQ